MYGPLFDCKRKVVRQREVCVNVSALFCGELDLLAHDEITPRVCPLRCVGREGLLEADRSYDRGCHQGSDPRERYVNRRSDQGFRS